ncbi:MAG: hypothetical protein IJW32_05975 [Clostridia bacterium]|nr:hypothetical protein [Clostridia bacterium]MBQ9793262.1 hypothetical protein [Clostridia bacterium]
MNKYRAFIKGIDFAFEVIIVLLLSLIWCRYFIDSLVWSLIATFLVSALISFGIAHRKHKKAILTNEKLLSNKKMEQFRNYLLFTNPSEILEKVKRKTGGETICNNLIISKDRIVILFNREKAVTKDEIITLIQNIDTTKITIIKILALNIENECSNFVKNISNIRFEIELINEIANNYYEEEIKADEIEDKIKIRFKQNAIITLKTFLQMFINPKNAKGYLFSAIILVFASLIVPQKIYYYIFASILLILSLTCKILKSKQS